MTILMQLDSGFIHAEKWKQYLNVWCKSHCHLRGNLCGLISLINARNVIQWSLTPVCDPPSRKTCLLQAKFFDTFWWSHGLPHPSENGNSYRQARYSGYDPPSCVPVDWRPVDKHHRLGLNIFCHIIPFVITFFPNDFAYSMLIS